MTQPTANEIKSAQTDGQAFGLTAAFNRRQFVRNLLNDPRVQVFDRSIVAWLLQSVEQEAAAKDSAKREAKNARDQLAATVQPLPKSKAIVKLAKIVARQADALAEVNHAIDHACDDSPNELTAFEDLERAISAWQEKHKDIIEAASYGD